jgi:hypothetical protein
MIKLSQQATAVALVSVLPVLASAYRVRAVDALVLSLTGMLAVYNVNCLTKGNCNAWANLVALSFFVTTIYQLRKRGEEHYDPTSTCSGISGDVEIPEFTFTKLILYSDDPSKILGGLYPVDYVTRLTDFDKGGIYYNMITEPTDPFSEIKKYYDLMTKAILYYFCNLFNNIKDYFNILGWIEEARDLVPPILCGAKKLNEFDCDSDKANLIFDEVCNE